VCAYYFAQLSYKIQHRQFWLFCLLTSRQSSKLRCCLLEGRGMSITQNNPLDLNLFEPPTNGRGKGCHKYDQCTCLTRYWTTIVIASNHFVLSHRAAETADRCLDVDSQTASKRPISHDVRSSAMELDTTSGCGDCFIRWDDVALLEDGTAPAYRYTHNKNMHFYPAERSLTSETNSYYRANRPLIITIPP